PCRIKDPIPVPAESPGRLADEIGTAVQTQWHNLYPVADIAPVAQLFVRSDDGRHHERRSARYGHLGEAVADIYTVKSHGPKSPLRNIRLQPSFLQMWRQVRYGDSDRLFLALG